MVSEKSGSGYGHKAYKLNKILLLGAIGFLFFAIGVLIFVISYTRSSITAEKREIIQVLNEGNFEQAYILSKNALRNNPVNYFLLTTNGFSAYQLGISQIDSQSRLYYIDRSIISLRKALLHREAANDGDLHYVLGKAYYFKGAYHVDLAIKHLEIADSLSHDARDIPEFLGLLYASIGDYRRSVEAFARAFVPGNPPADRLLLAIARSYFALEEFDMAKNYLRRCIDTSFDSNLINEAHFLLAEIYININDFNNAERQLFSILENTGENAEARFRLGELYNLQGDTTRARAEWRLAVRQDPAHVRARARLNI